MPDTFISGQRSGAESYLTTYTYDPSGNRLTLYTTGTGANMVTSTYDAASQMLTSEDVTGVTTYSYDAAGNQHVVLAPSGGRTTTTWSYENQPLRVDDLSGVLQTAQYNADLLRVAKTAGGATTRFLWDQQRYLAESDAAGAVQAVYTVEPSLYGNVISQVTRDGALWLPRYYHFDALGSTRLLTDSSQSVTDTLAYRAFGELLTATGGTVSPFRFVGRLGYYYDAALASYYIRRRVYQPVTARWLSVDPILSERLRGAYGYVYNGPTLGVDPSGLKPAVKPQPIALTLDVYVSHEGKPCQIGHLWASRVFLFRPAEGPMETTDPLAGSAKGIGFAIGFRPISTMRPCCGCVQFAIAQVYCSRLTRGGRLKAVNCHWDRDENGPFPPYGYGGTTFVRDATGVMNIHPGHTNSPNRYPRDIYDTFTSGLNLGISIFDRPESGVSFLDPERKLAEPGDILVQSFTGCIACKLNPKTWTIALGACVQYKMTSQILYTSSDATTQGPLTAFGPIHIGPRTEGF